MNYFEYSQQVIRDAIHRFDGKLPCQRAVPIVASRLGISRNYAARLVQSLIKNRKVFRNAGFLTMGMITCQCGAAMFPTVLHKTKGFCPHCSHYVKSFST